MSTDQLPGDLDEIPWLEEASIVDSGEVVKVVAEKDAGPSYKHRYRQRVWKLMQFDPNRSHFEDQDRWGFVVQVQSETSIDQKTEDYLWAIEIVDEFDPRREVDSERDADIEQHIDSASERMKKSSNNTRTDNSMMSDLNRGNL